MTLWHKECLLWWHLRLQLLAIGLFAGLMLLLFSLSLGASPLLLRQSAGAILWLTITFASTLFLNESTQREHQDGAHWGFVLLGVPPVWAYVVKALMATCLLWLLWFMLLPFTVVLYDLPIGFFNETLYLMALLGCLALGGLGTLCSTLALHSRTSSLLLPLVFYPLLLPCLLALITCSDHLIFSPSTNVWVWIALLGLFDAIFWLLGAFIFHRIGF
jgi:heme exporter protein B